MQWHRRDIFSAYSKARRLPVIIFRRLLYSFFRLPVRSSDIIQFEQMLYEINKSFYSESKLVNKIMNDITDEEVIYQKGEGPEVVFKTNGEMKPRKGTILTCKYFIAKRIELILKSVSDLSNKKILDVGATSNLLFKYLKKDGLGLNISKRAVEYMKGQKIQAVVGDAQDLKFRDNSFDYVFCFQTIEHLENPIKALRELKRVMREKVFLSIPDVQKTSICAQENKHRMQHRWHVLEFSPSDFKKILNRVGLEIKNEVVMSDLGTPNTLQQKLFCNFKRKNSRCKGFRFYELVAQVKKRRKVSITRGEL